MFSERGTFNIAMTKEADVPTLFFLQAFEQLCYKYDQNYEPTASFPKAPKSKPPPAKKSEIKEARLCTFQSKIADIRLKKQQAQIAEARVQAENSISQQIEEYRTASEQTQRDVSEAFKRERAVRSDVPLYLRNQQKDEEAQRWKSKKSKPINMPQIRKEFSERLKRSEQLGKTRAINRRERMAASIRESDSARRTISGKPQKKQQNYYAVSETESSAKGYYEN